MSNATLEDLRNQNIQRNKDLLKKLNLDALNNSIKDDALKAKQARNQPASRVIKKATPVPIRRSKRLRSDPEGQKELIKEQEEEKRVQEQQSKLKEMRHLKLNGEFTLRQLLTDNQGILINESEVLQLESPRDYPVDTGVENQDITDGFKTLHQLQEIVGHCSTFLSIMPESQPPHHKPVENNLKKLSLNTKFEPASFKLSHQRITSLSFHSSLTERLVFTGDTNGDLGLWAIDSTTEEGNPVTAILKPHGRSICKICENPGYSTKILSASYDGSARVLDLQKQTSADILTLTDFDGEVIPISDMSIHSSTPNIVSIVSLAGHFYQRDLRAPLTAMKYRSLLRIHDKKVGGFSFNPNMAHQFASASLDRTVKIWDLRSVSKKNSNSTISDELRSPHMYCCFTSRLSVSTVDWNADNHIVCNGYDDRIRVFDLSGKRNSTGIVSEWPVTQTLDGLTGGGGISNSLALAESASIKHNCQTGRWVSILKSKWQVEPLDGVQKFVIANMNRSLDVYNQTGEKLVSLYTPEVTAVPAVTAVHPTQNWFVGGTSSGKVYLFDSKSG